MEMAESNLRIGRDDYPVFFHGNGKEFFRIWIVNIFLSIITLGIYSAWAKVRTQRYFYGNTTLDGSSFEYHARPMQILKGRLLVVGIFLLYTFMGEFNPTIAGFMAIALVFLYPYLFNLALRFRTRNSGYRNLRFNFYGSYGKSIRVFYLFPLIAFILPILLAVITDTKALLVLIPVFWFLGLPYYFYKIWAYPRLHSAYGNSRFDWQGEPSDVYFAFFSTSALALVIIILDAVFTGLLIGKGDAMSGIFMIIGIVISFVTFYYVYTYFQAKIFNILWNNTSIDNYHFDSRLKPSGLLKIYLLNIPLILITFGLWYPFFKVHLAKYKLESLSLSGPESMDHFLGKLQQQQSATGEEFTDVFDIDIGF